MVIHLLGTSHGYAEKNRFTSFNVIVAGKENHSYIVDAGGPAESLMINNDLSVDDLRGIFITHMHGDHVGNLSSIIDSINGYRQNKNVTVFMPSEKGLVSFLDWMNAMHSNADSIKKNTSFQISNKGKIFENEDIRVFAVPTNHLESCGDSSFGYIIESENKRVLFTGDMKKGFSEYSDMVKDLHFDLVICEMAHSDFSDVSDILQKTNTDRMIINHYHLPRLSGYNEIVNSFPFPVELAFDGMQIII